MKEEHYYLNKKITFCVVCITAIFLLAFNLNIYAQHKLSFSFKKVPLKTAITEIEKQSGYKFIYSANSVDLSRIINAEFKETALDKVLQDLFTETGIDYFVEGKQISLAAGQVKANANGKIKIMGTVYDENGSPFPYLNVFDPDHPSKGVVTNDDGKYYIEVPSVSKKLSFSFMGYKTATVPIGKSSVINQTMELEAQNLDEVVIVGFGQQSKASVSASVSSIKAQEIVQSPVVNVSNAIAGRVAGVTAIQSSGQPGMDEATIYVRGVGTWNDATPLYVIDGVERDQRMFTSMDASEIESFTVLKDAAATAVYGSKGANGVILITSKRGTEGKVAVNLNASMSLQQFTRYPEYLNSYESLKLYNEALMNDGKDPLYSKEDLEHYRLQDDPYRYPDTDWYKLLMKKVAPTYNVSVNVRGGSKTVRYFVSGAFVSQDGQLKTEENRVYNPKFSFKRYRFSANIDAMISKYFTISVEMAGNLQDRSIPKDELDVLKNMNRMAPWYIPAKNPDGSYAGSAEYQDMNPMWMINTNGNSRILQSNITSSLKLDYKFDKWVKGLSANVRIAFDSFFGDQKNWFETQSTYQLISRPGRTERYLSYLEPKFFSHGRKSLGSTRRLDGLANIIYSRKFGDHSVRAQGIANFAEKRVGSSIPYNSASFIGRVNYSYKNKYHLEANASYRGSENFAPGKRFGLFPSISAGWSITEEKFMKNVTFINNLKLRASYGVTGRDYVDDDYRFLYKEGKWTTGASDSGPYFGYNGGTRAGWTNEPFISNPDATWEKARQVNVGIDITIWKDRFSVTFDRFFENRSGLLMEPNSVPSILGIDLPLLNIGKTKRDGWELEAAYNQRIGKDVRLFVKGNVSFVKNEILDYDEPAGKDWWLMAAGNPIGQPWGYIVEGFFRNQEEIDNAPVHQIAGSPVAGDLRYVDYNGDGVINTFDRVAIGYPKTPRISYGISLGLNIKNFDINVLFQGTAQSSIFINNFLMYEFYNRGKVQDIHLGRWTPETADTATYPALHIGATSQNHQQNTFFLKNNPYIRLKNVEVAYSLGPRAAKKLGMKGMRVYLSGVNLFTWDKLKVVDPETASSSGNSGIYPQSRNFSLGLNFNF